MSTVKWNGKHGRLLFAAALAAVPSIARGQSATWVVNGGGSWGTALNWDTDPTIPGGVGSSVFFDTQDLSADATVTLDGARTVGSLTFGDATTPSNNWIIAAGTGGTLTLDVSTGTPTINVVNQTATISPVIAGTKGLLKTGTGTLALGSNAGNTLTGGVTVQQGTLTLTGTNTGGSMVGPGTLTIESAGIVVASSSNALGQGTGSALSPIVINGGQFTPSAFIHLNSLTMTGGTVNAGTSTSGDGIDLRTRNSVLPRVTINASAGGSTIAARVTARNDLTYDVADGAAAVDLTHSGGIVGSAPVFKTGAGAMRLSGSSSYSGNLTVNGGTFTIGAAVQSIGSITVNTGATLETAATNFFVAGHGAIVPATRTVTVNAGGTWVMTATHDARIGNVNLNGGTWTSNRTLAAFDALLANVSTGAATVTVGGTTASVMNGTGGLHLQGVQNFDVADVTSSAAADLTVSMILDNPGSIGGAVGGINKLGAGTMAISRNTQYTGGTTVTAGVLDLTGGGGSAGTLRGTVNINAGGTLRLSIGDATGFTAGATSVSVININGGTLNVNSTSNQTLGSATINMTGGAITGIANSNLDFFGGASTLNVLESASTATISGVALSPLRQGNTTFTVADGTSPLDLVVNSILRQSPSGDAAGAVFTKSGPGTMALEAANTFARNTTVSAGTLLVNGSLNTTTTVTVGNGARLGGAGVVGAVVVEAGGGLTPGNAGGTASPGLLTTGALALDATSTISFDLAAPNAGVTAASDRINVNGALQLAGVLNIAPLSGFGSPVLGDRWLLFTYSGALTNNGITLGSVPTLSGDLTYALDTSTPGQVSLAVVVPEPASVGLMGIAAAGLLGRRRSKRR
jgi:autotransporter-associated beta strand protein